MNLPLHQFLSETFDKDVLRDASIAADNARGRSSQAVMYYSDDDDDDLFNGNDSLRSLPSLNSDSSVSRWDSCISSPSRKNDSCKSPPGRPTREYVMDKMSRTEPIKPIHLLLHNHHNNQNMHSSTAAAKTSSDLKNRLQTPPAAPRRKVSFQGIPRPPCLEALDSPTSVRVELSELLSKALEECGDLEDPYCDSSSISSNTDHEEETTVCVIVSAPEK
jgi:hypothetical protein